MKSARVEIVVTLQQGPPITMVELREMLEEELGNLSLWSDDSNWSVEVREVTQLHSRAKRKAPATKLCNICRVNRVPVGTHACEVCE